jgi:uncharacterized membrane protein
MMQVIWVIGASMIILAALIRLPLRVIAGFGIAMIALHNLLDRHEVAGWQGPGSPVPSAGAKLAMILHQPFSAFPIFDFPSPVVVLIYPLIPWVGVMALGYAFGSLYQCRASVGLGGWIHIDPRQRQRWLIILGAAATILFVALRAINRYGDPSHWSQQKSALFTVFSFLNTTKYPPSLLFLLMTLGPALLMLAWFESNKFGGWLRNVFVTFGRVPLFFYLLQWPMAHLLGVVAGLIAGQSVAWQFESPIDKFSHPPAPGIGFPLWVVYVCWIIGVLLLYPLCKWFAGVKARRRDWWLSYL